MSALTIHTLAPDQALHAEEAILDGRPLRAICGHEWVPQFLGISAIPAGTPRCPDCRPPKVPNDRPNYVYRYYDGTGRLLYVGVTAKPVERQKQHARSSAWFAEAESVRHIVFPTRRKALDMERLAIQTENPIHNRKLRVTA